MNSSLRVAHLDMDAFFASVELLSYPELRGQPVVVGGRQAGPPVAAGNGGRRFGRLGDYVGRGVVTTSTYEARGLGVFSGMGLMKSAQLAPEAILLPANFEAYRHYSRAFKTAVQALVPAIEDRGIDEIYLDLATCEADRVALARQIKAAVFKATGLRCSIGLAPNKLLAKIASDLDKPDGLTVLDMADLAERLWPLPVRRIGGIGPKSAERLRQLGIERIGQLAATPLPLLVAHFGLRGGHWLQRVAHGIDERPLVTVGEPKSLSRETTFERDLHARHDKAALGEIFTHLCQRLAEDLARRGYLSRTIGIKLRYADFHAVTRDITLPQAIGGPAEIRQAAGECLKRVPLAQKIRLLGVRAGGLRQRLSDPAPATARQGELPF